MLNFASSPISFISGRGTQGPAEVEARVSLRGKGGRWIEAMALFALDANRIERVTLSDVVNGNEAEQTITVAVGVPIPSADGHGKADLELLREIIGLAEEDE